MEHDHGAHHILPVLLEEELPLLFYLGSSSWFQLLSVKNYDSKNWYSTYSAGNKPLGKWGNLTLITLSSYGSSIVFINSNVKAKSSKGINSCSSYLLPIEGRALDAYNAWRTNWICSQRSGLVAFEGTGQLKEREKLQILFPFSAQLEF